jgi:hypothetical protein
LAWTQQGSDKQASRLIISTKSREPVGGNGCSVLLEEQMKGVDFLMTALILPHSSTSLEQVWDPLSLLPDGYLDLIPRGIKRP